VGEQARVLQEDPALELLQGRRRVDAELVGQPPPVRLVGAQRVGLTSTAVQAQQLQLPSPLAEGVLLEQGRQVAQRVGGVTELQPRRRQLLERPEAELVEASDVRLGELRVGELRERRPPPEAERRLEGARTAGGVTRRAPAGSR
jgi:hypothetical protein